MQPSEKSPEIGKTIKNLFGFDQQKMIKENKCVPKPIGCGQQFTEDEISAWPEIDQREYKISGLCSNCQKGIF